MTRAYVVLDRVAILAAVTAIALGLFLASFGTAMKVQEHSFPNTQHITPTPYPGEHR